MYEEKNTGTNLPAQIDILADTGNEYKLLFVAKGGGSANKMFLFQETKAILNPTRLPEYIGEKLRLLGTAACPPYHLAVVIGGTSAETTMKTLKLASAHYYDELPTQWQRVRIRLPGSRTRGQVLNRRRSLGSALSSAASILRTMCV